MGNYVLLESIQLASTAASVVFDNIPQSGYTDLKVVMSTRTIASGYGTDMTIALNGSTSNFEGRRIYGYSGAAYSDTQANVSGLVVGASATASTFSVNELYITNYLSSNHKSYSIDAVSENNSSTAYLLEISANRWLNTAAINSITFGVASSSFDVGSSFSLYGVAATGTTPAIAPKAFGGNVTNDGTYWIHTFNSTGAFVPLMTLSCDYLVVAGGGGGGSDSGGGGGAGGYKTSIGGSPLSLTSGTAYTVTIGAGGSGSASTLSNGTNGSNSVFSSITSTGGGFGGSNEAGYNGTAGDGAPGGSGGGAGAGGTGTGFHTPGAASPSGQGSAGGLNYSTGGGQRSGGGGGGAGAAGSNGAVSNVGGNGGNGLSNSITGAATYYAGGGGGTGASGFGGTVGTGGLGGGAAGSNSAGIAGTTNTGGGGGASASTTGGSGGSGIVIVRYTIA